MDIQILARFFMGCTILNVGLLMLSFIIWILAADFVYRMHSRWFPMPRETFNVVFYSFLGVYKILLLVLNVAPWAALSIMD
jgi:hypothetical protein